MTTAEVEVESPSATTEGVGPSARNKQAFWIATLVILAGALITSLSYMTRDPSFGYCQDRALTVDGYWYLADARAHALDESISSDPHYRQPVITTLARVGYAYFGVGFASSRFVNIVAHLLAIAMLCLVLKSRLGSFAAIAGATVLALHPVWLCYVKSPVIYPFVSAWILCCIIGIAASGKRMVLGVAGVVIGVWGVKSLVGICGPAIIVELYRRVGRSRWRESALWRYRFALLAATAVVGFTTLGPWAQPVFWRQIANYTGFENARFGAQLLAFESRSWFFSSLPVLFALGAFGAWIAIDRHSTDSFARVAAVTVMTAVPLFALARYSPLRYMLFLLPLLIYLSAFAIVQITRREQRSPVWLYLVGSIIVGYFVEQGIASANESPWIASWSGVVLAIVSLAGILTLRRHPRVVAAVPIVCLAIVQGPRTASVLAMTDDSQRRAGRQVLAMLPEKATLAGPFAHPLTVETHLPARQISGLRYGHRQLAEQMVEFGCSHLLLDGDDEVARRHAFEADGVELELIDRFVVRRANVLLYRVSTSTLPRSSFEEARRAWRDRDLERAERTLRRLLSKHRDCAAGWELLGDVKLAAGDPDAAHAALCEAARSDPGRVSTWVRLAELYERSGYRGRAVEALRAALSAQPEHTWIADKLDELTRD